MIKKNSGINHFTRTKKSIKLGNTPAVQYKWYDGKKPVAQFTIFDWWDGKNIENLKVFDDYRGQKYSYDLLDYAVKECGAKNLSVRKDNNIAIHVYEKYGFKVTETDDDYIYMSI